MPVCFACGAFGMRPLCLPCRRGLRPGGSLLLDDVAARYALHHSATGRRLVHQLKYHGVSGAADVLASLMVRLLPPGAVAVVPVPRAVVRRVTYGVDPAWELATRIGRLAGLPVVKALRSPLWWPRHAGRDSAARRPPPFRPRTAPPWPCVLVDDVITSGTTVRAALATVRPAARGHFASVISATSPGMIVPSKAPIASGRLHDSPAGRHR